MADPKRKGNVLFNNALLVSTEIGREETRCRHYMGYSFRSAARVLLYASSHRQDTDPKNPGEGGGGGGRTHSVPQIVQHEKRGVFFMCIPKVRAPPCVCVCACGQYSIDIFVVKGCQSRSFSTYSILVHN